MRRPNYGAVTGVTMVLAVVCAMRLAFESLIPPPHPEVERLGAGEFVGRAETQEIRWRTLRDDPFAEAQKLSRPLFLAIGVPWSGVGRRTDEVFMSPDVAQALDQGFVPVRIDAAQDPRWISQFLPLQRTRSGMSVGFQGWVVDLKGRLIAFVGRSGGGDPLDATTILDRLFAAQAGYSDAALSDDAPTLEAEQSADVRRLLDPGVAGLSLANAVRSLRGEIDPGLGAWSLNGIVVGRPLAYRFLQLTGDWSEVGSALRRTVLSPRADWLDGGFFREGGEIPVFEYDKPLVENAQFAEALAAQDAVRPDPLLRKTARRTVAWMVGLLQDGLLPSAEAGDEDEQGRSARSSFSPRALSDAVAANTLTPSDRAWAEANLGLQKDPRISVPTPDALASPRLDGVLRALRRSAGEGRETVAEGLCEPNGTVAACLLRCARLWNDRGLAVFAGTLFDRLEAFRTGPGLRHALTGPGDATPYLGDSLAYADAALEDYLANGRVPSLQRGTAELRRALRVFGGPEPGILRPSPRGTALFPHVAEVPQVTDDEREALSATALRLLDAYAMLLGTDGSDLAKAAADVGARVGTAVDASPAMGGALGALARHTDARTLFVTGPEAVARASRLFRRLPNRLVVPVLGPVRPELRGRPPGAYLSTLVGLSGPFDERAALERMPAELEVGQ